MPLRTRSVDPHSIVVPPVRVTSYMSPELQEEFKSTVQALGILEPPLCIQDGDTLYLVDGLHRLQEAIAQGHARVTVLVREGTLTDAILQNLVTATQRGRITLAELVRTISHLYHECKVDTETLARRTGLSLRYIDDLLVIWEAGDAVRAAIDRDQIGKTHALLLAAVEDPQARDRLLSLCIAYDWTVKQLELSIAEWRRAHEAGQAPQAPPAEEKPPPLPCHFCSHPEDPVNLRSFPMCPACYALAREAARTLPPGGPGATDAVPSP